MTPDTACNPRWELLWWYCYVPERTFVPSIIHNILPSASSQKGPQYGLAGGDSLEEDWL